MYIQYVCVFVDMYIYMCIFICKFPQFLILLSQYLQVQKLKPGGWQSITETGVVRGFSKSREVPV